MPEELAKYSPDDYLPARPVMERIVGHLKVALRAEEAPPAQVLNAARVCAKFNLEPSHDVHLYKAFGNNWILDIGVRAYQNSAERWERETGDKLIFDAPRRLTEAEMKADLGDQYDPGKTVGVEISCVKMSQIQAFRLMGREVPMTPYRGYHFGGKGGRNRDGWFADKNPGSTETKEMQARRRAKKKAFMNEIGLHMPPVTARSWQTLEQNINNVLIEDQHAAENEIMDARYTTVELVRDEDGDVLFAPEMPRSPTIEADRKAAARQAIIEDIDATHSDTVPLPIPEPATAVTEVPAPGTDEAAAIIAGWASPPAAQQWMDENGFAENGEDARMKFAATVEDSFNGKLTKKNMPAVFAAYYQAMTQPQQ